MRFIILCLVILADIVFVSMQYDDGVSNLTVYEYINMNDEKRKEIDQIIVEKYGLQGSFAMFGSQIAMGFGAGMCQEVNKSNQTDIFTLGARKECEKLMDLKLTDLIEEMMKN